MTSKWVIPCKNWYYPFISWIVRKDCIRICLSWFGGCSMQGLGTLLPRVFLKRIQGLQGIRFELGKAETHFESCPCPHNTQGLLWSLWLTQGPDPSFPSHYQHSCFGQGRRRISVWNEATTTRQLLLTDSLYDTKSYGIGILLRASEMTND